MDIGSQRYTGSIKIQKYPKYFGSTHISPKTVGWQRCAYGNFIFTWVIIVRLSKNRGPSCTCQSNSRAYPHCPLPVLLEWLQPSIHLYMPTHPPSAHCARTTHNISVTSTHTLSSFVEPWAPMCQSAHDDIIGLPSIETKCQNGSAIEKLLSKSKWDGTGFD